jgi:DNA-binding HxlR family transcriptional regulator
MSTPKPGRPVRGSSTGRPVMVLLDVLGRRWALRILWELRATEHTFRGLQDACGGVSPTVLNERLRELQELGLVERGETGYGLSKDGHELEELLIPLDDWASRWARRQEKRSS